MTDAAAIAKAAVIWAESGSKREAVRMAMDLDELVHQVATLHGAMCLLNRMNKDMDGAAPAIVSTTVHAPPAGMGGLYRSAHEPLPLFKKGRVPHVNNVELGSHDAAGRTFGPIRARHRSARTRATA